MSTHFSKLPASETLLSVAILGILAFLLAGSYQGEVQGDSPIFTQTQTEVPSQPKPAQGPQLPPNVGVNWSGPGWYVSLNGTAYTPSVPYLITLKPADTCFFCPGGPYPSEQAAITAAHAAGYFEP